MWNAWKGRERHAVFSQGNLKENDLVECLVTEGDNTKMES
jgi:hypothetical protein